jgi:transcriptional regulator with XRE-family HTH domain
MKVQDKIRSLRVGKGWTQENMAEKLNLSVNGYANIERGETEITLQRLEQIAQLFEMNYMDLLNVGEKQLGCYFNGNNNQYINQIQSDEAIAQENVRLNLEVSYLKKEVELLNREINGLKEINQLLKEKN